MKNNLQTLLKRFDEKWDINSDWVNEDKTETSGGDYAVFDKDKIKAFLVESIKDALESCRVGIWVENISYVEEAHEKSLEGLLRSGFNKSINQYDENVRKFLED